MMDELILGVRSMVGDEYGRAAAEHGAAAHSPHEGYALIKEEVEEAEADMEALTQRLDHFWNCVKGDDTRWYPHYLKQIRMTAVLGACELIQVAAMAEKALKGYENMKEEHDNEKTAESDGEG